jgi:hypothetical protein
MSLQWMTIAEAAALMKIHPRTVERRAAAGKVESRRNDDGQVQVRMEVPDEPPAPQVEPAISNEAFETVREMADRQVDIAAGTASALVRADQEQAMRAEHQVVLAKQEAGRYRRETQMALALVAVMLLFVIIAVGWCTSTITAARADAQFQRDRATAANDVAHRAGEDLAHERERLATATSAEAKAEGELVAYKAGVATVIEQTRPKPASRPTNFLDRVQQAFLGTESAVR